MPAVAKLRQIRVLSLQGASVSDAGLAQIRHLEITHLRVDQTPLTDTAIPILKQFPKLRSWQAAPNISPAAKAEFDEFLKRRSL